MFAICFSMSFSHTSVVVFIMRFLCTSILDFNRLTCMITLPNRENHMSWDKNIEDIFCLKTRNALHLLIHMCQWRCREITSETHTLVICSKYLRMFTWSSVSQDQLWTCVWIGHMWESIVFTQMSPEYQPRTFVVVFGSYINTNVHLSQKVWKPTFEKWVPCELTHIKDTYMIYFLPH